MGNGKSAILHQKLVKEQKLFNSISCFISGDIHPGTIYVAGYLTEDVDPKVADKAIVDILDEFKNTEVSDEMLNKVKNKYTTANEYSNINILDRAMNLAYYELLGDVEKINTELDNYLKVSASDIKRVAQGLLIESESSTLYYLTKE